MKILNVYKNLEAIILKNTILVARGSTSPPCYYPILKNKNKAEVLELLATRGRIFFISKIISTVYQNSFGVKWTACSN
jgi:hypothetical protein